MLQLSSQGGNGGGGIPFWSENGYGYRQGLKMGMGIGKV